MFRRDLPYEIRAGARDADAGVRSRRVERSEANAYATLVGGAPPAWRARHRVSATGWDGGLVLQCALERAPMVFNRVLALGWETPIGPDTLAEIDASYREAGAPHYAFEVAPTATFGDPAPLLRASSFLRFGGNATLCRDASPLEAAPTGLVVRRAGPGDARAFARLVGTLFRLPEDFEPLFEHSVERGEARHWLAFDGDTPVATATTVATGPDCDWIGWVGTLPSHRGRGAQSALTAAQVAESARRGAAHLTLEVDPGRGGTPGASFRNYLRMGWRVVHERTTWLRRLRD